MTVRVSQSDRFRTVAGYGGFTLLEMVVTVAIMSVIMLGLSSAMIIAGHAVPDADNSVLVRIAVAQAAERLAAELQYVMSVNSYSVQMIEFTVADRDGNAVPETIRYEWSGTAGDPLTRQYNGGASTQVLTDVQDLTLAYEVKTVTTPEGTTDHLQSVQIQIQTSTSDQGIVQTGVRTLNEPEVTS